MTALGTDFAQPAPGKTCGSCTLCCKVVGVAELKKPADVWCGHCNKAKGCKIYDTRPLECRTFYCLFLLLQNHLQNLPQRYRVLILQGL